jgi:hypothetical protein
MSVVGAVLVLSSVAYACVQSRGEIFVTGDNGGVSTAVGNGHHPGAGPGNYIYCKAAKYLKEGATSFSSQSPGGTGKFTVQLGMPPTDCRYLAKNSLSSWIPNTTTPNVFPDGTYEVNFCQGQDGQAAFAGGQPPTMINYSNHSCFYSNGVTDYGTLVGTITVTNHVGGPKMFNVPFGSYATQAGTLAGISVRDTTPCQCGPPPVNMAPIAMI